MLHHRAIILIGVLLSAVITVPCLAQTDESNSTGLVEVEPTYVVESRTEGKYELVPYAERRGNWGAQFGIGYAMFTPTNFESEFLTDDFENMYGSSSELPMLELLYTLKRNYSFGAIGAELVVGIYQNSSDIDEVDSKLELIPIRLGVSVALDRLFSQPYMVPYISTGAYIISYKETMEGGTNELGGTTQVAPYVTLGAQFSLDWLDAAAARTSYEDSGIQGTFVFLEGRKFFAATGAGDPDFETAFEPSAGLRVEF